MSKALDLPSRQHIARTIEDVHIDYQRFITAPAAQWLQNNDENP
jgi:hypothetical protein